MPKVYFKDDGLRNVALNRFFDTDALNFWRTSSNKEIDFVINTSYRQGSAYEVKLKCKNLKRSFLKTFGEHYPNYPVEVLSYNINNECRWVLKL